MSQLLKTGVRVLGRPASQRLMKASWSPNVAQREFLFRTLRQNAETAFGRLHNFAAIRTEADFRRQVSIRDYEDFRPFVNRIIAGEKAVLTKRDPLMLTMTSGTTGESKLIPVTLESQRSDAQLMNCWFYHALKDHPAFLNGKGIGIVSRAIEGYTPSGIPYGSMSGLTYRNLPLLLRRIQAIPYNVFEIGDYDERYFLMAFFALSADVSFMATPNPSTLIRLAEVCHEFKEELIRAVHNGMPCVDQWKQPHLCAQLLAGLNPDRVRASALARLVKSTGTLRPADFWPNLSLLACWVGGSVGLHARKLAAYYGEVPVRDLGYMASEGHFTVPLTDGSSSGVLAVSNNYYEFIPEEEAEVATPAVLPCHALEEGKRYSILLTTAGGLCRYRIGDIVEVTGFAGRAPVLAFVRKDGEMASITGEKMHVNHLILAVERVRQRLSISIQHFRATPDFMRSRYDIYLELSGYVPDEMLRCELLPELDRSLGQFNLEYAQKRQSRRLEPPRLHLMTRGWASVERRLAVEAGKRDAQYKWKILCAEPQANDLRAIERTIEVENYKGTEKAAPITINADAARGVRRALVA